MDAIVVGCHGDPPDRIRDRALSPHRCHHRPANTSFRLRPASTHSFFKDVHGPLPSTGGTRGRGGRKGRGMGEGEGKT